MIPVAERQMSSTRRGLPSLSIILCSVIMLVNFLLATNSRAQSAPTLTAIGERPAVSKSSTLDASMGGSLVTNLDSAVSRKQGLDGNSIRESSALDVTASSRNEGPFKSGSEKNLKRDKFRFSYFGMPIGEVTLIYHADDLPDGNIELEQSRFGYRIDVDKIGAEKRPAYRLIGLEGESHRLFSWIKSYRGEYLSEEMIGGTRYQVDAVDQGVSEERVIWFSKNLSEAPQVDAFKDRTANKPLQSSTALDSGSLDPIHLMRALLVSAHQTEHCSANGEWFNLYDGKRRYSAVAQTISIEAKPLDNQLESASDRPAPQDTSITGEEAPVSTGERQTQAIKFGIQIPSL